MNLQRCFICNDEAERGTNASDSWQIACARCGKYEITRSAKAMLGSRLATIPKTKARLSHAVMKRSKSLEWIEVNSENLDALIAENLPNPRNQVNNLLDWMFDLVGDDHFKAVEVDDFDKLTGVLGTSDDFGVEQIFKSAENDGYVEYVPEDHYRLTTKSWALQEANSQVEHSNMNNTSSTDKCIFIGHGRSTIWRELKDFLHDRLGLKWEEFNRVTPAGFATTERLETMLSSSTFAFLLMTAEDEASDGKLRARQNVVHEVGLFQGRLGFNKAIVLMEEGCEEFSNISGLGQIRFPNGNISAKFEEVRRVLEREGQII